MQRENYMLLITLLTIITILMFPASARSFDITAYAVDPYEPTATSGTTENIPPDEPFETTEGMYVGVVELDESYTYSELTDSEKLTSIDYSLRVISGGVILAICSLFTWFTILKPLKSFLCF